ncbi:MAG: hypothetical protein Q8S73_26625 [Deltaproteobacteria bacterium]|nr:hypothetical protein [Myxococcales bacterium]MDP3217711.1 hypothetical protein [Deltaproteobacteria bacterium]
MSRNASVLLCLALAACSSDPAPSDVPTVDAGWTPDTSVDAQVPGDVGDDRPGPMDVPADRPPATDTGADAVVKDWPFVDLGGAVDAGTDAPPDVTEDRPGDAGSDVPADVRVVCTNDDVRCTTNEQCQAVCLPYAPGRTWCCPGRHHCIPTTVSDICPPYMP